MSIRQAGARLANVHLDPDHHRSVFSFLGGPDVVHTAAQALADNALAIVDLRNHHGSHPRIGALDVLPFVPISGLTMDHVVALAHDVGRALAERHELPVYFYGFAALRDHHRRLPDARRGAFDAVEREAQRRGVAIRRGELVGLAPRAAFAGRTPSSVGLSDFTDDLYLDTHLTATLGGE